jgi:hypothetical protein
MGIQMKEWAGHQGSVFELTQKGYLPKACLFERRKPTSVYLEQD